MKWHKTLYGFYQIAEASYAQESVRELLLRIFDESQEHTDMIIDVAQEVYDVLATRVSVTEDCEEFLRLQILNRVLRAMQKEPAKLLANFVAIYAVEIRMPLRYAVSLTSQLMIPYERLPWRTLNA